MWDAERTGKVAWATLEIITGNVRGSSLTYTLALDLKPHTACIDTCTVPIALSLRYYAVQDSMGGSLDSISSTSMHVGGGSVVIKLNP
jgi:hypothetical protein